MWESPLYLEYAGRERIRELAAQVAAAHPKARLRTAQTCGVRRHLARHLVSLGLYLDPQTDVFAGANSRPHAAHR
jgi:hypothetical protein